MSIYLDASFLVPMLVDVAASDAVKSYLVASEQELLVSEFAAAEVASSISRLVRMGLLTAAEAVARLSDFDGWRASTSTPTDVHPADVRLAYAYVRRFELGLRAPDALHLAIAHRADATLVTLDRRLADAARELGVSVAVPGADSAGDAR